MNLELTRPLIFFDLETTGVDPLKDRIVEISVLKLNPDGSEEVVTKRMNPQITISQSATETHGITDDMVKDLPTFTGFANGIREFISGCDIAGYNSDYYDNIILQEEFKRTNIIWPDEPIRSLDIYRLEQKLHSNRLTEVYKRYTGKELDGAHGAAADTQATKVVLQHQLEEVRKELDLPVSLDELLQVIHGDTTPVDLAGKIYEKEGEWYWSFGKHKNEALRDSKSYCDWVLGAKFSEEVKGYIRVYLEKLD